MKTVIDAVNEFKGVWPHESHDAAYYGVCGKYWYFGGRCLSHHEYICDNSVFNQCVEDMIILTKPSKPVYTQAMCDAGTLPLVGMECIVLYPSHNMKGVITYMGDGVGCFYSESEKSEYSFSILDVNFKPIEPPIELVDGKAYQFKAHTNRKPVDGFYSADEDEFVYLQGTVRSHDAINIKLLEVK